MSINPEKMSRIDAVMKEANARIEPIERMAHERCGEMLEAIAARSGPRMATTAALSADLMRSQLMAMEVIARAVDPRTEAFETLMERQRQIHANVTAHMIALAAATQQEADRETNAILAVLDQQFESFIEVRRLANEATDRIQSILSDKE